MLVKTFCAAVNGLEVTTVTVEVSMSRGVLYRLTGLPDNAVKESRDRIAAAMTNIRLRPPAGSQYSCCQRKGYPRPSTPLHAGG